MLNHRRGAGRDAAEPQTPWVDPALPRRTAGAALRPAHGEDLRTVAQKVSTLPRLATPEGDGQRRGECLPQPPGGEPAGEPLHPEPGPIGAVVPLPRTAGTGPGAGGCGAGAQPTAAAGGADPRGGAGRAEATEGCRRVGGGAALRQRPAVDGGVATAGP